MGRPPGAPAANLAIDRKTLSQAEYLGFGKAASSIIPRDYDFYWAPPEYPHDPARAKQLLAEAGYPKGFDADIDALFRDQAAEPDRKRREALLHRIQQLMHERAMFAPIVELPLLIGIGSRLGEAPTIPGHPYLSPYEDLKLR